MPPAMLAIRVMTVDDHPIYRGAKSVFYGVFEQTLVLNAPGVPKYLSHRLPTFDTRAMPARVVITGDR